MRSNDPYDVSCVNVADHRQLHRFVLVFGQEPSDAGPGGDGFDMDVGVEFCPILDPAVQFVVSDFAEVFFPDSDCQDRRMTQSRLVYCVFDDRLVRVPLARRRRSSRAPKPARCEVSE